MAQISVHGQLRSQSPLSSDRQTKAEPLIAQPKNEAEQENDLILAARTIVALKRLDDDVLIYRSLGDFEANGRIARVSYEVFKNDLQEVIVEVEPILSQLPQSRLKIDISNALASYRDGEFWWQRVHKSRVVNASAMSFVESSRTPSDEFFVSTIPYTVAIHWREAHKYLQQAEKLVNRNK